MEVILYLIIGYLIGSIPFGLIITQKAGLGDIRTIGSGNIGATNVLRTGNKKLAILTLIADMMKGFIPALIVLFYTARDYTFPGEEPSIIYGHTEALLIGFGAILGHCFSMWLKFKGGKGIATAGGVLLAAVPLAGLLAALCWIATAYFSRISSLSALVASAMAPVFTYFMYGSVPGAICVFIAALAFYKHRANIARLAKGEEPKIELKK